MHSRQRLGTRWSGVVEAGMWGRLSSLPFGLGTICRTGRLESLPHIQNLADILGIASGYALAMTIILRSGSKNSRYSF
jgi:hypothetical protein